MQVRVEQGEDGILVQLSGPVGPAEGQALLRTARALLLEPRTQVLRLDLAAVSYLDSSALGMLLQLHELARSRGAGLVLQHPSEPDQRLLQVTNLDRLLVVERGGV